MSQNLQLQKITNPQLTRIRHRTRLNVANPRFAARHPAYANFLDREAIRANATPARLASMPIADGGVLYKVGDKFTILCPPCVRLARGMVQAASLTSTGVLTLGANAAEGETVTIGTTVYKFTAALVAAFDVLIGALATDSIDNLIAAITAGVGEGVTYGTGTTANPVATAAAGAGDTMDTTAIEPGDGGNLIATTETGSNMDWDAVTLQNGIVSAVSIINAGEFTIAPGLGAGTTGYRVKNGTTPGAGLTVDAIAGTGPVAGVTDAELLAGLSGVTDLSGAVPTITRARHFRDFRNTDVTYTDNGVPVV